VKEAESNSIKHGSINCT